MNCTATSEEPARLKPYLTELKGFEGFSPTMYRDSADKRDKAGDVVKILGYVTVGYGTNLSAMSAAERGTLPFYRPTGPIASAEAYGTLTQAEIEAEYDRVYAMEYKKRPEYYRSKAAPWSPQLTEACCAQLLLVKVLEAEQYLKGQFSGYRNFPEDARFALIDMAYNMGSLRKFPHLRQAIEPPIPYRWAPPNWMEVAAQSLRPQVSAERNLWTRRSFERAGWHTPMLYRTRAEVDGEMRQLSGAHSHGRNSKSHGSGTPAASGHPLRML